LNNSFDNSIWAGSFGFGLTSSTDHTFIVLSELPEANSFPSVEKLIEKPGEYPVKVFITFPVSISHIFIVL
jgi:hypothetical protein